MSGDRVARLGLFGLLSFGLVSPLRALSYVESSTGLEPPALEEGRTEVEMADLDGDGNLDLVSVGDHGNPLVNSGEQGIMVWFGNGAGSWSQFQFGNLGYGGIAVGDVNGDGLLDVGYGIHHNYSSNDLGDQILEVALGDGTGRFWTAWDDGLATNGETWGMFGSDFADVDGDGDLDLGSISFGCCNGVHVYLNRGDGSWSQSFATPGGNSDMEIVFGDVNGDGWPDFASSDESGTVYLGDGRGGFSLSDGNLPPKPASFGRAGVALGDVNGDGRDDLAWINDSGGPEVWIRNGDGSWTDFSGALPNTGSWQAAQLWDMDGDGIVDLAAFGGRQVTVWTGNGAGAWTQAANFTTPAPGNYSAFRVGGDADHNGRPDIVLVSEEGTFLNLRNHLRFYKETTSPKQLRARVVHPGPNTTLRSGVVVFVDWAAEVPRDAPGTARLEYSLSGSAGPWYLIGDGLPNNGRAQWIVPDAPGTEEFRIRVTITAGRSSTTAVSGAVRLVAGHDPLRLVFLSRDELSWTDRMNRTAFNLYRSDWNEFLQTGAYTQDPAAVPAAARWCRITSTSLADPFLPAPSTMVFYLVTGVGDVEGSLGTRSDGTERPNANPCP
jgi:hypothetical protein